MIHSPRVRFIFGATLAYVVFAALWIFFSDQLLERFADPASIARFSTMKGFSFIGVTAALLFLALQTVPPEQEALLPPERICRYGGA